MSEEKPKGLVELVQKSATHALEGLERGFEGASATLGRGLEGANAALATPAGAELATLLPSTDLPGLADDGPLGALATRLDREADLHRGVALRELARVSWVLRVSQTVWVVSAACEIVIAGVAVLVAVLGTEGRGGLLALAAAIVAASASGVAIVASRTRGAHAALAGDALGRARDVEDRLFRVGLALEWRRAGDALYQDALARLERDTTSHASD